MMSNLTSRIRQLEHVFGSRRRKGPRLTEPNRPEVILHVDDVDAIAEARAAGRVVMLVDEPGPTEPVL
jgi:hypothetical protein